MVAGIARVDQFLTGRYGPDYRNQLRIVAEADSIYCGLALLRSNLVHAAMLTTSEATKPPSTAASPVARTCATSRWPTTSGHN